jgi:hypothetical protein
MQQVTSTCDSAGPLGLLATAACFGLATGLFELVLLAVLWSYDPAKRLGIRLVNRHYLWMIPLAQLVIFGVCGLVLVLIARIWPKVALRIASYVLCGLSSLSLLLLVPELHKLTNLLLACGATSLAAPLVAARMRRNRLRVRRALFWQRGALAALAIFSHRRELISEYRARRGLREPVPGVSNVLLIVLDIVRADALSLHGSDRDTSPNLERLARQGVRFDRARATDPWTLPYHASMFI